MTLSAAFTVNGNANPAAHAVAYGATVTLALTSISGVDSVSFSIVGSSKSGTTFPVITAGGTPTGATSTFAMPADPGGGLGRSFRVRCVVTNGSTGETATSYGVVGAVNAAGVLPVALGEELDRDATYGWTDELNEALAGSGSTVTPEKFGATGDGVANDATEIQAAIDSLGSVGGIVDFGAKTYLIGTTTIDLPNKVTLRGVGKASTTILYSGTGAAIKQTSPIDSSTAVHTRVLDMTVQCSNGSNVDGGIVDIGGTFVEVRNVRTIGFRTGIIFDQTELAEIDLCDFESPIKSGIWLVNGAEYSVGADIQFTNRISVSRCQFNAGEYGVIDDGGYIHSYANNNHNGATVAHLRLAGVVTCSVRDSEVEVGPKGIILSATSESGSTGVGSGSYTINDNIIVVDTYSVQCDSAGAISAYNNLLYGTYAFTGMSACSIANGSGNSIPGVAVKTIYQSGTPTISENWAIPSTGSVVQNVFRKERVNDIGNPLIWVIGDDASAITDYSGTPDYFTTFPNRGSLGGTFDGASTNRPEISSFYTKLAPIYGNGGTYDNLLSSLSVGNFTFLHNAATNYTLTARVRTSSLAATQTILATFNSTLTNYGIYLYVTTGGALTLLMGNGSGVAALNIASAGGVIVANTNHTIQATVSGTAATVYVDGTSVASGTITSPSATAASTTLYIGSHAGAVPWIGLIPEVIIQHGAQDAVQRSLMSTYIGRWA